MINRGLRKVMSGDTAKKLSHALKTILGQHRLAAATQAKEEDREKNLEKSKVVAHKDRPKEQAGQRVRAKAADAKKSRRK